MPIKFSGGITQRRSLVMLCSERHYTVILPPILPAKEESIGKYWSRQLLITTVSADYRPILDKISNKIFYKIYQNNATRPWSLDTINIWPIKTTFSQQTWFIMTCRETTHTYLEQLWSQIFIFLTRIFKEWQSGTCVFSEAEVLVIQGARNYNVRSQIWFMHTWVYSSWPSSKPIREGENSPSQRRWECRKGVFNDLIIYKL